jgi:hypothetical protein
MTHAQGAIQEGRLREAAHGTTPDLRAPIYTSNGGYSFHADAPSSEHPAPFSHRTACTGCVDFYQGNPHVHAVGEHPSEVRRNPKVHPQGSTNVLGTANVPTFFAEL